MIFFFSVFIYIPHGGIMPMQRLFVKRYLQEVICQGGKPFKTLMNISRFFLTPQTDGRYIRQTFLQLLFLVA
jgi:hypothetical protein